MTVRNDTILNALRQEEARIEEALKMDRSSLEKALAAIKHTIAVYEARAAASSQERLPKTLQAAAKLRSENGNGKIRNANGHLINPASAYQQKFERMRALLSDPNNAKKTGMAAYINNGLLTKSAKGVYALTPKGKARLQELTDASTP